MEKEKIKMAKVIVLQGKENVGKSTTLRELLDVLNSQSQVFTLLASEKPSLQNRLSNQEDVWAIFKNVKTNKVIGITTRGDDEDCLCRNFDKMKEVDNGEKKKGQDCDIYICAAHLYGKTVDYIVSRFNYKDVYFYGKVGVPDNIANCDMIRKGLNSRDVKVLYNHLM